MRIAACILACTVCLSAAMAGEVPFGPVKPAAPAPAPTTVPAQPVVRVNWRTNLEAAQKEAADSGRVFLIYFHADWSQPCRWMDGGTLANRAVAEYVNKNFVPIKVDDTKEAGAISKKYQVRLYPTVLFLDPYGDPLHILLGPKPPGDFYPVLQKVKALPGLVAAQKKSADDVEANFAAGAAFATLDQLRRAEPYLKRVVELDPKNEKGHLHPVRLFLALVPLEDGDSAQAIKNVQQFLTDNKDSPERPTAIYWMAAILYRDNKLKEARGIFDLLRNEYPSHRLSYDADKAIDAIDDRLKAEEDAKKPPPAPPAKPAPARP